MSRAPTNAGYTCGYSEMHTDDQDREIAREALLAASDTFYHMWSHETMDDIGVALIIDSRGGPSAVDSRVELDWMAVCCAAIGTMGPEPVATTAVDMGTANNLVLRQNLYINLVTRANHLAMCDGLVAA